MVVLICFSACSDDDDKTCAQSDWVAQYAGTETCGGDAVAATAIITASGTDGIEMAITADGVTDTYSAFSPTACNGTQSFMVGDDPLELTVDLDGSNLKITRVFTGETCTYDLNKI